MAYLANNNERICEQIGKSLSEKIEQKMQDRVTDLNNRIDIIAGNSKEELDVTLD